MDGKQIETFVSGRGARLSLKPHFYPLIISVLDVLRNIVFESKKTRLFSHLFFVRAHASCHKCREEGEGRSFDYFCHVSQFCCFNLAFFSGNTG